MWIECVLVFLIVFAAPVSLLHDHEQVIEDSKIISLYAVKHRRVVACYLFNILTICEF